MAKVTAKSSLVLGTNYKYHIVDIQGTDIEIDATNSEILSTSTDFTATSETNGVVTRAPVVGDIITLYHTGNVSNEGVELEVTSVAANVLGFTIVSGTPADQAAGADINIQAFKKQYQFLEVGDLNFIDGVQGITWASQTVDDWDTQDFDRYLRIFTSIEPRAKSLAALNGWEPFDADTLLAQRDMALEIKPSANAAATKIYACLRSPDLHEPTDQYYFWSDLDPELTAPTAAVTTGYMNQLVLIFDSTISLDDRGTWNYRCLEPGKTHVQGQVDLQFAEIQPIQAGNAIDVKAADGAGTLLVSDATVLAGGIYANITLNVDATETYLGDVDGIDYTFIGYQDADGQSNQDLHIKNHYLLRQPTNINSDGTGPVIRGDKSPPLTEFVGDRLDLNDLYPLNYNASERNFLNPIDSSGSERKWPSIYGLDITGTALSIGGTFSIIHKNTYGTSGEVALQDELGTPQRDITITALTSIIVAYSTYAVDGHSPDTPIQLVLTWNKPGDIEPDSKEFTMSAANNVQQITATVDPSYVAA